MTESKHASAPLPLLGLASLIIIGAALVRAAYVLTNSASAAAVVGSASLLLLVVVRSRQARRRPDRILVNWEQLPSWTPLFALVLGVLIAAVATVAQAVADAGWAAVTIFVGGALIAECLVRMGADKDRQRTVSRAEPDQP